MIVQLSPTGKVYTVNGKPVVFISKAEKLADTYLAYVYSQSQGIIGAGIRSWSGGLPVGIAFSGGAINNATGWYDYNAAKRAVVAEYQRLLDNNQWNDLKICWKHTLGIKVNELVGVWHVQRAYDLSMQLDGADRRDVYAEQNSHEPQLRQTGLYFDAVANRMRIARNTILGGTTFRASFHTAQSGVRQSIASGVFDTNGIVNYGDSSLAPIGSGAIGAGEGLAIGNATNVINLDLIAIELQMTKIGTNNYTIIVNGVDRSGGRSSGWRERTRYEIGGILAALPYKGLISYNQIN